MTDVSTEVKELRAAVAVIERSVALLSQSMEMQAKAMEALTKTLTELTGPDGRITALERLRWMGAGMLLLLTAVGGLIAWGISVGIPALFHSPPSPPPSH